jgi:putative ABC transport system permease protein
VSPPSAPSNGKSDSGATASGVSASGAVASDPSASGTYTAGISAPKKSSRNALSLLTRLAVQNLLRRPARTFMLVMAVALGTGAVFASFVIGRGIEASMEQGFARMGADLLVVPSDTMVNITSALLTVQPTDSTFDIKLLDEIKGLTGVAQVAPQTIYRVPVMSNMPEHRVNLIAFDPKADFTILPWLQNKMPRTIRTGDLIVGGRRTENIGDEIEPCCTARTIFGKLGRSGVGPFDESIFATYDTVAQLAAGQSSTKGPLAALQKSRISAVLVRLDLGATPEQVRFAIARLKGIKVITGATIVTATRQSTSALLTGMLGFAALMLFGSLILVSLIFSAIIQERRREIGLLSAIGTRRGEIVAMLVTEAAFATSLGGFCGILFGSGLLLLFQRSLLYHLALMHVDFAWPVTQEIVITALACAALAAMLGLIGALFPAWRSAGEEAYILIKGELG